MEAKLKSVLNSPALALLLRTALFGLALFWFRGGLYSPLKLVALIFVFLLLYLRPIINSSKYWASGLSLILLIILVPRIGDTSGFYLNLLMVLGAYMLLGVKNLVFIKRSHVYQLLHMLIFFGLTSLTMLGLISPIIYFISTFFLFKEFYSLRADIDKNVSSLVSAIESMISVQMVWATSFFSATFIIGASFITLVATAFHNLFLLHTEQALNKQNLYKQFLIFGIVSVLVAAFSAWIIL